MKLITKLTVNGVSDLAQFAARLRLVADAAEAEAEVMTLLGSTPPKVAAIDSGTANDIVFQFNVEGSV